MRNKGAILTLAVALTLVCLFQLSFTWKAASIRNAVKEYATKTNPDGVAYIDVNDENYYLDSVANEVVYNAFVKKYTYRECQQRELNFGLDLKGGMNIILEISSGDILRAMVADPNDETFRAAITKTRELQKNATEDYITVFGKAYEEVAPGGKLATLFSTPDFREQIDPYNTTNSEVISILREEAQGAIDNAFNIITTRIDQFGVAQPNIQRLESGDRILVDLPGVKDKDRVRKLLEGTAHLEFWECYDNRTNTMQTALLRANEVIREYLEEEKVIAEAKAENAASEVIEEAAPAAPAEAVVEEEETQEESEALTLLDQIESDTTTVDSLATAQDDLYPLFSILYPRIDRTTGAPIMGGVIGTAHFKDTARVNFFLRLAMKANAFPRDIRFIWDAYAVQDENRKATDFFELYAIKTHGRSRAPLEGDVITNARQEFDQQSATAYVSMNMNTDGAKRWARITRENVDSTICVVMDNRVYSGARVQQEITGGSTQITGSFSIQEAQDLANLLKSGKLPAPAHIIQETVVGPSLGEESVKNGMNSFGIAFVVILLYMLFYYSYNAGFVSNIALIANMFFIIGVLASLGAALTLPGIAGIVLTIGMSVDANVLIYERIREEIAAGKGLKMAITDGYKNAYSAIIDANVTTLITGFILLVFGTGPIRGFATTLVIGICTSLFSAIFITRIIIDKYMSNNKDFKFSTKMTEGAFKGMKVSFIEKRKIAYVISAIIILGGVASLSTKGLNLGVDFKGGRNLTVKFDEAVNNQEFSAALAVEFGEEPKVIKFGQDNQVRITTRYRVDEEGAEVDMAIQRQIFEVAKPYINDEVTYEEFAEEYVTSSLKVGPTIADDIQRKAVIAIVLALTFMFLYIILRFRNWQFGFGAVAALVHDTLIVLGLYSIFWGILPFSLEIDQAFIAAILTVVGYSINDTVVVFDRIREYIREHPKWERTKILNAALNSTLSRTFSTSLSTFVVLLTIFVFGGEVIRGFVFALLVGVIVGTYSSLFVATPIVYDTINKEEEKRVLKGKKRS